MKNFLIIALSAALFLACSEQQPHAEVQDSQSHEITEPVTLPATLPPLMEGTKIANCKIGPERYEGPCVFLAETGGTFSVSMRDQSPIYEDVTVITVAVTGKSQAQVFGLTTYGNNSRWGQAMRSKEDPACWAGSDFQVCAY